MIEPNDADRVSIKLYSHYDATKLSPATNKMNTETSNCILYMTLMYTSEMAVVQIHNHLFIS